MTRYPFALAPFKFEGGSTGYDAAVNTAGDPPIPDDIIKLPSGREFDAHGEVVGIGPDGSVCEGWDRGVETDRMSAEDRRDLADLMIRRWTEFKEKAS